MSEVVAVGLITGGLTLLGSVAAQCIGGWTERQRARRELQNVLKMKTVDYEREDRLALVRPVREYLNDLGRAFGSIPWDESRQDREGTVYRWHHSMLSHLASGTALTFSISDKDVRDCLLQLQVEVPRFAKLMCAAVLAEDDPADASKVAKEEKAALERLDALFTQTYECLDRYGRNIALPA